MSKKRKQYTEEFKAMVALEAIGSSITLQELAAKHGVAPGQICEWKQQLQQGAARLFVRRNKVDKDVRKLEKKVSDLEQLVGQREYELAWLKKGRCARFYDWAHIGINLSLNSLQVDSRSLRYSSLIDEMPRT